MVNDVVTKDCFRADHLLEEVVEELLRDPMLKADRRRELEDLQACIDELNVEQMSAALKDTNSNRLYQRCPNPNIHDMFVY